MHRRTFNSIVLFVLFAAVVAGCATGSTGGRSQAPRFEPLFNGVSLDGWRAVGGEATYVVEGRNIVGTVGPGPNSFLRTERTFSDFELQLELRLDEPGNSGVQFRSHQRENGRVFGYQCEVDPKARAWSGGVYDEGRRGWLFSLEGHEEARAAFRVEGWNHYRIRAVGTRIQTWVNGVECADFHDDADSEGFIALQVHAGKTGRIRWRNIRLKVLDVR